MKCQFQDSSLEEKQNMKMCNDNVHGGRKNVVERESCNLEDCSEPVGLPADPKDYELQVNECPEGRRITSAEECKRLTVEMGLIWEEKKIVELKGQKPARGCYVILSKQWKKTPTKLQFLKKNRVFFNSNATKKKLCSGKTRECVCMTEEAFGKTDQAKRRAGGELHPDLQSCRSDIEYIEESLEEIEPPESCGCDYAGEGTDLTQGLFCQSDDGSVCYNSVEDGWCNLDETLCSTPEEG